AGLTGAGDSGAGLQGGGAGPESLSFRPQGEILSSCRRGHKPQHCPVLAVARDSPASPLKDSSPCGRNDRFRRGRQVSSKQPFPRSGLALALASLRLAVPRHRPQVRQRLVALGVLRDDAVGVVLVDAFVCTPVRVVVGTGLTTAA